ncbi:MAG: MFS transporter [Verrucomicrobia bacterium]|nr:MFS transporter [Verrucomicrobiota bacterium]
MTTNSSHLMQAWLVVGLLWVVALLNYLDRVMITTMRGSLMEAIPMTDAQFGLLTSVFLWVYAVLSPFAGFLADRFSRSRVILWSLLAWSALTWLTGHAKTFDQLLVVRAMMGVSEATYIPAALALITDYHRGSTRSLATGVHMTGISVGSGLGGLGGWLAERYGWSYAFTLFGIIGIVYAVVLMFALRDAPREEAEVPATADKKHGAGFVEAMVSLFGSGTFLLMLVFWGLLGMTGWAVVGWMPTYLNEHFHLSQGVAGLSATGYLQAASLVGFLVGGGWADRWSRTNPRARILVPVIGLCLAAPGVLIASQTTLLPVAIAGLMLYGLARVFTDSNMMPILCLVCDPRYRATGYGVLNLFSCAIGGLSIYAGGALRDAHVNVSNLFLWSAVSLLVCAGLVFLVKPKRTEVAS